MNILVADDREANRQILKIKLSAHGYTSELAANGVEALALLRKHPFDAVVTDLLMPAMDGYQLTHAIKTDEQTEHIPVIIYTSTYTDAKDAALARNLGANAFIIKPASDELFFKTLADTIGRAAKGQLPSGPVNSDELNYLKEYTARLIRKLEDKVNEAALANEQLAALNAQLEQRVTEATQELRDANTELETFVNSVSHDLRSPLNTIQQLSSILTEDGSNLPAEERNRLLLRIDRRAAEMRQLIEDLLGYSHLKQRELHLSPVDLGAAVQTALDRISSEISTTRAAINVAPGLPRVLAFEPVLTQAIANLISNAVKFVGRDVIPVVNISSDDRGDRVRLQIADNGIGIPAEYQNKIFNVFERLHSASQYPGTGIGLALVKRAMQKMGGQLAFTSTLGKGSVFWLELPKAS